jgi:magnesium chelatase family protein
LGPRELQQFIQLDTHTLILLKQALTDLNLSARAYHRILKVARTIADLAGSDRVTLEHVSEAVQYRSLDRRIGC